jgi:hypothetical protein
MVALGATRIEHLIACLVRLRGDVRSGPLLKDPSRVARPNRINGVVDLR